MAKWNVKVVIFNRKGGNGGFTWNSRTFLIILRINEVLKLNDKISENLARLILTDKTLSAYDSLFQTVFFGNIEEEKMIASDAIDLSLLFEISENLGIKDDITDLAVLAFLRDKFDLVEDLKTFANILESDNIKMEDIPTVEAFLELMSSFGMKDLKSAVEAIIESHDMFGLTDREPRQAVSDFMIGAIDNDDRAYDWLIPFGMRVDWGNTNIQIMPEAELTTIEMPGIDGSIVEDSVYKDRLFTIVAYSKDGLTTPEKEDLKSRLTQILDATKHKTKKLTVQARGTSFDVRYQGQAEILDGPSFVKATIGLHTPPYGYELFENDLSGSGLIDNGRGDAPLRTKHTITGPVSYPSFTLGAVNYVWNGVVPSGYKLVINHDLMTCYLEDNVGKKTNALANLSGDFQEIPPQKSVVLVANTATESHIFTEWRCKVLW